MLRLYIWHVLINTSWIVFAWANFSRYSVRSVRMPTVCWLSCSVRVIGRRLNTACDYVCYEFFVSYIGERRCIAYDVLFTQLTRDWPSLTTNTFWDAPWLITDQTETQLILSAVVSKFSLRKTDSHSKPGNTCEKLFESRYNVSDIERCADLCKQYMKFVQSTPTWRLQICQLRLQMLLNVIKYYFSHQVAFPAAQDLPGREQCHRFPELFSFLFTVRCQ